MITTTWTKRSEQEPVQTVAPVIYGHWRDGEWIESSAHNVWGSGHNPEYTHWRSIKVPPPPRELTQRERDNDAAKLVCERAFAGCHINWVGAEQAIRNAIYVERMAINAWLDKHYGPFWGRTEEEPKCARELRARLDEQGGGK